jgi:hypothetical protein
MIATGLAWALVLAALTACDGPTAELAVTPENADEVAREVASAGDLGEEEKRLFAEQLERLRRIERELGVPIHDGLTVGRMIERERHLASMEADAQRAEQEERRRTDALRERLAASLIVSLRPSLVEVRSGLAWLLAGTVENATDRTIVHAEVSVAVREAPGQQPMLGRFLVVDVPPRETRATDVHLPAVDRQDHRQETGPPSSSSPPTVEAQPTRILLDNGARFELPEEAMVSLFQTEATR